MISIIVPVYNVEEYLDECLQSIKNQTFGEYEVILIDDGSTDASGDICDWYVQSDKRFVVIHQSNQGVSCARNNGIAKARGEYILIVDADDWLDNTMLEELMVCAEQTKADMCISGYREVSGENVKVTLNLRKAGEIQCCEARREIFSWKEKKFIHGKLFGKLIRKDVLKNIFFNKEIKIAEDKLYIWRVLQNCKKIYYIPNIYYNYRMRPQSALSSSFGKKNLTYVRAAEVVYNNSYFVYGKFLGEAKEFLCQASVNTIIQIYNCGNRSYDKEQKDMQKIVREYLFYLLMSNHIEIYDKLKIIYSVLPQSVARYLYKFALNMRRKE